MLMVVYLRTNAVKIAVSSVDHPQQVGCNVRFVLEFTGMEEESEIIDLKLSSETLLLVRIFFGSLHIGKLTDKMLEFVESITLIDESVRFPPEFV
jgi:hypothetical protein